MGENNETIECVQEGQILFIGREDFDTLCLYKPKRHICRYFEGYNAMHTKRFEVLNTFDVYQKILHLKKDFPNLIHLLNDQLLASFLGISREYLVKNKSLLH